MSTACELDALAATVEILEIRHLPEVEKSREKRAINLFITIFGSGSGVGMVRTFSLASARVADSDALRNLTSGDVVPKLLDVSTCQRAMPRARDQPDPGRRK